MIIIDLDNFKCINDSMGHQKGDEFVVYLEKMLSELEITIEKIKIKSTIGVAYNEKGKCNFKELYKLADLALYTLKKQIKEVI